MEVGESCVSVLKGLTKGCCAGGALLALSCSYLLNHFGVAGFLFGGGADSDRGASD